MVFTKTMDNQNEKWKTNPERGRDILVLPPTNAVSWFLIWVQMNG